ncbi:MAG: hypothetical protein LBE25_09245 [Arthrobacter sp.]|jgi:hypothetical protein|nr:hypothetical protein [Arthrobacter sp.]
MARTTPLTASTPSAHRTELIFAGPAVLKQPKDALTRLPMKGGETR